MAHPISGPISPEELKALADAPYGKAAVELRKYDPLWGKLSRDADDPQPVIAWNVCLSQEVTMRAHVTVEARTEEEAMEIAENLSEQKLSWDQHGGGSIFAEWAEPK